MSQGGLTASIEGMDRLQGKLKAMKAQFDGAPVEKLAKQAAQPIAQQAKRNARRGPSGLLQAGIGVVGGKKASKFGALAIARAKWRGTGAVFEEWGTKEHGPGEKWRAMRIPLSKLSAAGGGFSKAGKFRPGGKTRAGALVSNFGYFFAKSIRGMTGTHFFEKAAREKLPESARILEDGCKRLVDEAVR